MIVSFKIASIDNNFSAKVQIILINNISKISVKKCFEILFMSLFE